MLWYTQARQQWSHPYAHITETLNPSYMFRCDLTIIMIIIHVRNRDYSKPSCFSLESRGLLYNHWSPSEWKNCEGKRSTIEKALTMSYKTYHYPTFCFHSIPRSNLSLASARCFSSSYRKHRGHGYSNQYYSHSTQYQPQKLCIVEFVDQSGEGIGI